MDLERYELGNILDWSSLVFVRVYGEESYKNEHGEDRLKRVPRGYIFVTDPKFGSRAQWKLPAGHKADGETPLDTAVRELLGETNLSPELSEFRYEGKWLGPRKDHWKCLFSANIHERELGWMNSDHPENEGERPEHFKKLVELALVLPGPELSALAQQNA